ncbi:hypothetical protein ACTSKR_09710 [Chitinibacteraceae bacterium HSL-7]
MPLLEDQSASFILRIWREHGDASAGDWRGSIEHVQSGERRFFRDFGGVERFMSPLLAQIGIDTSQRFWEQMSPDLGAVCQPGDDGNGSGKDAPPHTA